MFVVNNSKCVKCLIKSLIEFIRKLLAIYHMEMKKYANKMNTCISVFIDEYNISYGLMTTLR